MRFVSNDLTQMNVSSSLVLAKSVNQSARINLYDLNRLASFGKAFLFSKLRPGDEPVMCSTPRSSALREIWRVFTGVSLPECLALFTGCILADMCFVVTH